MIKLYKIQNLPKDIYNQCIIFNRGSHGGMQDALKHAKNRPELYHVGSVVVEMDKDRNVRSWALVYRIKRDPTEGYRKDSVLFIPSVHVFTRPQYRRQGYGLKVMEHVAKEFGSVFTSPWDNKSKAFFQKVREQNKK